MNATSVHILAAFTFVCNAYITSRIEGRSKFGKCYCLATCQRIFEFSVSAPYLALPDLQAESFWMVFAFNEFFRLQCTKTNKKKYLEKFDKSPFGGAKVHGRELFSDFDHFNSNVFFFWYKTLCNFILWQLIVNNI